MDEIVNIKEERKKHVSYSQFSGWLKCPYKFYLDNVKGLKVFEDSINTCFGTAMHNTLQLYIQTLYTKSFIEADTLELNKIFKSEFENEVVTKKVSVTEDEMTEFLFDGEDIIKAFSETSTRIKHFPSDKYEFIDVELEIDVPIKNNVNFVAYVDLVLKEKKTGDIKIFDFKTSTNGWNKYACADFTKLVQLFLYKAFYSKKFGVPLNKIDVEFFILKRRLYEKSNYPQSRIQNFIPNHGESVIKSACKEFIGFLNECFTPDGKYIDNVSKYPKNPGDKKKNCKYCPHKKVRCDQKQEMTN